MLHLVNKSPFERNSLDTCLRYAVGDSAILLLEDGVYAAMKGTAQSAKIEGAVKERTVYVIGPDLAARGLDAAGVIDGVKVVGYDGFVDAVAEHGTCNSWL